MSRLIAFGCSHTFGQALPDCFIPPSYPGEEPSRLAWPQVLAHKCGLTCVNMAVPGASNKSIWYRMLNFQYQPDDIVFVLWASVDRSCLIIDNESTQEIGPWLTDNKLYRMYYKHFHNEFDSLMTTKLYVNHINNYIKNKIYNLCWVSSMNTIFELGGNTVNFLPVYFCDYTNIFPRALDNGHPGVEAHDRLAEEICRLI